MLSRFDTRVWRFAEGESAREARRAAKLPPNARTVKNSQFLICYGICAEFRSSDFALLSIFNGSEFERC
jgi:hypothetical protein